MRRLVQRLEGSEAASNRACIEARQRVQPQLGAAWLSCNGVTALFDGVGSPLTQSFGLGLQSEPNEADLDRLEDFFEQRGANVSHEVAPVVGSATLELFRRRGYQVCELTNMLWLELGSSPKFGTSDVGVRLIGPDEVASWAELSARGWAAEDPKLIDFCLGMGQMLARCPECRCFFAEKEGRAIATGSLFLIDGVAILAGASTPPEFRRQGGQSALLAARLQFAREQGCEIAMVGATPFSRSQSNAEAAGFQVAYTRLKWTKGG